MRRLKHPFDFELTPDIVEPGTYWLVLAFTNLSSDTFNGLDVRLNSLNTYSISVVQPSNYIASIGPGEKKSVYVQITARGTGDLYVTADGRKNNEYFSWESGAIRLTVSSESAELKSLFAMTAPYPPVGHTLTIEATLEGKKEQKELTLEFWVEYPSGRFEQIGKVSTKKLAPGEAAKYTAEVLPKEKGFYRVYAYLYDEFKNIGTQTDIVEVL